MPTASWVVSSSSSRKCLNGGLGARGEENVVAGGRVFFRLRGGPMRINVLSMTALGVEGERDTLSGLPASVGFSSCSSSCIVSLLVCFILLTGFVRDLWEADEGVISTFCFLDTCLGSSSGGVRLVFCRFLFPREGSPDMCELLSDVSEMTGESVVRLPDINEVRELRPAGLFDVGVAGARGFFGLLGTDAMVGVCPQPSGTKRTSTIAFLLRSLLHFPDLNEIVSDLRFLSPAW